MILGSHAVKIILGLKPRNKSQATLFVCEVVFLFGSLLHGMGYTLYALFAMIPSALIYLFIKKQIWQIFVREFLVESPVLIKRLKIAAFVYIVSAGLIYYFGEKHNIFGESYIVLNVLMLAYFPAAIVTGWNPMAMLFGSRFSILAEKASDLSQIEEAQREHDNKHNYGGAEIITGAKSSH